MLTFRQATNLAGGPMDGPHSDELYWVWDGWVTNAPDEENFTETEMESAYEVADQAGILDSDEDSVRALADDTDNPALSSFADYLANFIERETS